MVDIHVFRIVLFLLALVQLVHGESFTLRMMANPAGCFGGSICNTQPVVSVINSQSQVAIGFVGTAYIVMGRSPIEGEPLYYSPSGTDCSINGDCGTKIVGDAAATVPFQFGIATFSNLIIRPTGDGFMLRIVAVDKFGAQFAFINTAPFSVMVGSPFKMIFARFLGTVEGGTPFNPSPTIAVADRGDNPITVGVEGSVIVYLAKRPACCPNEPLRSEYANGFQVPLYGGSASFSKLYINSTGYPYQLGFIAVVDGIPQQQIPNLFTKFFTVSIGPVKYLKFESGATLSMSSIYAGEFFRNSVRIYILDAGFNLIEGDSTSAIQVTIYDNPSGAILSPDENRFVVAKLGKVTFSSLKLDKRSEGVRLGFQLYSYNSGTGVFFLPPYNVFLLSERFNVLAGLPRELVSTIKVDRAWAGGSPFEVQPKLTLVDYGGNILSDDYSSTMKASLISSPGTSVKIRIDTTSSNNATISNVTVSVASGTYGVGQVIVVNAEFVYDAWVTPGCQPFINLTGTDINGVPLKAKLISNIARSQVIPFTYVIAVGDAVTNLDYLGPNALIIPPGCRIYDGNNNNIISTLPATSIYPSKEIIINTDAPVITNITTTAANGEYGVGDILDFQVTFDMPVVVTGSPLLKFDARVPARAQVGNLGDSTFRRAKSAVPGIGRYLSISSDQKVLTFRYTVGVGENTASNSFLGFNDTEIIYSYNNSAPATIKRFADTPTTNVERDFSLLGKAFNTTKNIVIDTAAPKLDTTYGVQTNHSDGTFATGEIIFVTIKFNKQVINSGLQILLKLNCGTIARPLFAYAAFQEILPDSQTLLFKLEVPSGSSTLDLDMARDGNALELAGLTTTLRRKTANSMTDCDLSTAALTVSGNSLSDKSDIVLVGSAPVITSVTLQSSNKTGTTSSYEPDSYFLIAIKFNLRVAVTCIPVLVIPTGSIVAEEEAVYYSGNRSDTLVFKYTVQMGDFTNRIPLQGLYYRFLPNALCVTSGCPIKGSFEYGYCGMYAMATHLKQDVDLSTLPKDGGTRSTGVPINTTVTIVPTSSIRGTSISRIYSTNPPRTYGSGSILTFVVEFTDVVRQRLLPNSKAPRLWLNIGRWATYIGGLGSKKLSFAYIVINNDTISELKPIYIPGILIGANNYSPLKCERAGGMNCELANLVNQTVPLKVDNSLIESTGLVIDKSIPYIKRIYTNKKTSPYDGEYTIGETVDLLVEFSRPVIVAGPTPQIYLDVNPGYTRPAFYAAIDSATYTTLTFRYTVIDGDNTPNLMYLPGSIFTSGGLTKIFLRSEMPEVEVDYTLPGPNIQKNLTILAGYPGANLEYIRINTLNRPQVINVTAITPPIRRYAVGDVLKIEVKFDKFVIATGRPFLNMNCGKSICVATCIGYDKSALFDLPARPVIPSPPTKTFYYSYVVKDQDFNSDFDYIDQFSLFAGINDVLGAAFIFHASSSPTALAIRDLPRPGTRGSLSFNSQILVDGFVAYLKSIEHVSAAGTYGAGSLHYIKLSFSVPVSVTGFPYILMETGDFDRPAMYHHGSNSDTLFFKYIAQPGDSTLQLDYATDRASLLSSAGSFQYNGGKIFTYSENPSQLVSILLNTPGGVIGGTTNVVASVGSFTYLDLSIRQRGPDYNLEFFTSPNSAGRILRATQSVFVSFSNEFEVRPLQSQIGDMNGYDLDINNNIAVIGCPNCNVSVTTIQTVTTTGMRAPPQMQVQIVKMKIKPQPLILSFHTSAAVGETVQGHFSFTYSTYGSTRLMPVNIDGDMMTSIIAYDLVRLGNVTVSRQPYIYCACNNAFTWTLTFNDLNQGHYDIITLNAGQVEGVDGTVGGLTVIQNSADIKGSFTLKAYGKTSRDIPYDSTAQFIKTVLPDIELSAELDNIQTTSTEKDGTRSWLITFNAHVDSYEIPLLISDATKLTGGETEVFVKILRPGIHGPRGLSGTFQLEWRGNTTVDLPVDASAAQVKAALEATDIINYVNVWRSDTRILNGYVWTIEFVDYNYRNSRNYYRSDIDNVERIIPHSKLIGTDTQIVIGAIYETGRPINTFGAERHGSYGDKAGSIYVFQNTGESWDQVATIIGSKTDEDDKFGTSVSIVSGLIIVGSIGADKTGFKEKQSIFCKASAGTFKLRFRGWETAPIPFDVTREALVFAMVSEGSVFAQLYGVNGIEIDDWGDNVTPNPGLCTGVAGHRAVITFLAPVDGATQLNNGIDTGSDIENLQLIRDTLVLADPVTDFAIEETQKGTWKPHGAISDVQQSGAAYIFRDSTVCAPGVALCLRSTWSEEAILYPNNPVGTEKFGTAVSICSTHAVVGAPGAFKEAGSTYVFAYDIPSKKWVWSQELMIPELVSGDNFGQTVDIQSRTIIVGAPNAKSGRGAVYVFRRPAELVYFSVAQVLLPPLIKNPLFVGDLFGWSVALDDNQLVCGAPGMDDRVVYRGRDLNIKDFNVGGAYVFQRDLENSDFTFFNKLAPSNVRKGDRFGYDVAISGKTIAVSAVENFGGHLTASKAIIEIITDATYNASPLRSTFRLKWMRDTSSGTLVTRDLSYNIGASDLQVALISDLKTGKIIVSRDFVDRYNGGYSWRVTFIGQTGAVPLFEADYTMLLGTNAKVIIRYVNEAPARLRGNGHIFQQSTRSDNFVEQLLVNPFSFQPVDRCGFSIAVSGDFAFLGCPNRDSVVSNQNAGSGFIFSLSLLHIKFASYTYTVQEGQNLPISVIREGEPYNQDIAFYIQTVNRNDFSIQQTFIQNLYGINPQDVDFPSTFIDFAGIAGTACGRTQDYGSTDYDSVWVDGMYDYRGISDYVQLYLPLPFLSYETSVSAQITTNADTILEYPNENFTIALYSPGLWPSVLGRLYSTVTIQDDSDGIVSGKTYYDKLYQSPYLSGTNVGKAMSLSGPLKLMVAGSPLTPSSSGVAEAGAAFLYSNWLPNGGTNTGWSQTAQITSPSANGKHFGEDVAVTYVSTRNIAILAITEPSTFLVHVYLASVNAVTLAVSPFSFDASLAVSDQALLYGHYLFGSKGTLALNQQVLAIGIPGFESVYVFNRRYDTSSSAWKWVQEIRLRSSEYDYDYIYTGMVLHHQYFGYAISISERTIVVGSPFADYQKLGTYLVELNWDTQGETMQDYSRGRVYSFFSTPGVQTITLNAIGQLAAGTFKLSMSKDGLVETSSEIRYTADALTMEMALELLQSIDDVSVTASSGPVSTGYFYSWTVTFHSEWVDPPLLVPTWRNVGSCTSCIEFDVPWTPNPSQQVSVARTVTKKALVETQVIQNPNPKSGDNFGAAVALDGDQIIVGAPSSGSIVSTTWDFEAGTLIGWSKSGNAFDFQPTFGDNSYYRNSKLKLAAGPNSFSSRKRGKYSIATFDKRPGDPSDYTKPHSVYPQGNAQGDSPVGTLTSEVFIVSGTNVDFIIGGTCDIKVYVELIVDGLPMDRVTSTSCTDAMLPTNFNLTLYQGRAAQIRIVDGTSGGHINVDDFRFNWDIYGASVAQKNKRSVPLMKADTPKSGAAFTFVRQRVPDSNGLTSFMCDVDKTICRWNFETILLASDKRPGALFGTSVALNNNAGVACVGAPGAAYTGFYKEVPSVYPFINGTDASTAAGLNLPVGMSSMYWFQTEKTYNPLPSAAHGIWYLRDRRSVNPDGKAYVEGGAAYVFTKSKAIISGSGTIIAPQFWQMTEVAKVQPPDEFAGDHFGFSVALSDSTLAIGAPGNDGAQPDGGSLYVLDASFAGLSFQQSEFPVLEGTDFVATVTVLRDVTKFADAMIIEYATTDVTARGVDTVKYDACFSIATNERGAAKCGDYEQTRGFLTIPANANSGGFKVRIMNDLCYERYMKYIQVTISTPGFAALQGEKMSARIRIDDDDYNQNPCSTHSGI